MWHVTLSGKAAKQARELPKRQYAILARLIIDLELSGPIRGDWPNYSALGKDTHHCHLSYRWVACWGVAKQHREIEIYYVGSRENAPY